MSRILSAPSFVPRKIFIEDAVKNSNLTTRIVNAFPDKPREHLADATILLNHAQQDQNKNNWRDALLLAKQRGPFVRLCPGTQKHICCLYHNLDLAAGCDLGCTYCILQGYLNNPLITLYANMDDMYDELHNLLSKNPQRFYRIGTGELSDSLTFDHITHLARELVAFFSDKKNAIIELKSKNIHIDDILHLNHNKRTVMSWSLNSQVIAEKEESRAAPLDDRLRAAREAQSAGFRIGFHFDPMIEHQDWQDGYRKIVDRIFDKIHPESIAWISLGALRYPSAFDEIIRANHPQSDIVLGELLPGIDKKLRYFEPIRIEMFSKMHEWIKSYSKDVFVYLCMESSSVWRKAFGWSPKNSAHLKQLLDERVKV